MRKVGESVKYYIFNFFLNKKMRKYKKFNDMEDPILFQCWIKLIRFEEKKSKNKIYNNKH